MNGVSAAQELEEALSRQLSPSLHPSLTPLPAKQNAPAPSISAPVERERGTHPGPVTAGAEGNAAPQPAPAAPSTTPTPLTMPVVVDISACSTPGLLQCLVQPNMGLHAMSFRTPAYCAPLLLRLTTSALVQEPGWHGLCPPQVLSSPAGMCSAPVAEAAKAGSQPAPPLNASSQYSPSQAQVTGDSVCSSQHVQGSAPLLPAKAAQEHGSPPQSSHTSSEPQHSTGSAELHTPQPQLTPAATAPPGGAQPDSIEAGDCQVQRAAAQEAGSQEGVPSARGVGVASSTYVAGPSPAGEGVAGPAVAPPPIPLGPYPPAAHAPEIPLPLPPPLPPPVLADLHSLEGALMGGGDLLRTGNLFDLFKHVSVCAQVGDMSIGACTLLQCVCLGGGQRQLWSALHLPAHTLCPPRPAHTLCPPHPAHTFCLQLSAHALRQHLAASRTLPPLHPFAGDCAAACEPVMGLEIYSPGW